MLKWLMLSAISINYLPLMPALALPHEHYLSHRETGFNNEFYLSTCHGVDFFSFSYLNPGCILTFCGCEKGAGDVKNSLEAGTRTAFSTLWFCSASPRTGKTREDALLWCPNHIAVALFQLWTSTLLKATSIIVLLGQQMCSPLWHHSSSSPAEAQLCPDAAVLVLSSPHQHCLWLVWRGHRLSQI